VLNTQRIWLTHPTVFAPVCDSQSHGQSERDRVTTRSGRWRRCPHAVDAFKRIADETRLAILLALWEAYEPFSDDNTLSFSELLNQVDYDTSGNFSYHLQKLEGYFVESIPTGYYDSAVIVDAPDERAAKQLALGVTSTGTVTTEFQRAFHESEVEELTEGIHEL
jgi:hypothetical protein